MDFVVVIPARFAATRLPGKVLLDIAGKPMVVRVAERAAASGAAEVWVATDDERVRSAVVQHGYRCVMTGAGHRSGTDRIAEVAAMRGWSGVSAVLSCWSFHNRQRSCNEAHGSRYEGQSGKDRQQNPLHG